MVDSVFVYDGPEGPFATVTEVPPPPGDSANMPDADAPQWPPIDDPFDDFDPDEDDEDDYDDWDDYDLDEDDEDDPDALSELERVEFAQARAKVTNLKRAWVEAFEALAVIRDRRLYREEYATFDEFCRAEFGFNDSRGRQIAGALSVALRLAAVKNLTLPNVHCAQVLGKFDEADQMTIARIVMAMNEKHGDKITGSLIQSVGDTLNEVMLTGGRVDPGDGQSRVLTAALETRVIEEVMRGRENARSHAGWVKIAPAFEGRFGGVATLKRSIEVVFDTDEAFQAALAVIQEQLSVDSPIRTLILRMKDGDEEDNP